MPRIFTDNKRDWGKCCPAGVANTPVEGGNGHDDDCLIHGQRRAARNHMLAYNPLSP